MSSNKNLTKQIKRNILNNNCDYDVICELLVVNPEEVISGILSSYLYLFRNIDNISNKDLLEDLDTILNNYIKKYKNKKTLELVYNKIEIFLGNLSKSFNLEELVELFRNFAASQLKLYYKTVMIRLFISALSIE